MKVVFRKYSDGEVVALFCNTEKDCKMGNVMSYMHSGQHGEAAKNLGNFLKLATPQEYDNLKREIENIYNEKITPVSRLKS